MQSWISFSAMSLLLSVGFLLVSAAMCIAASALEFLLRRRCLLGFFLDLSALVYCCSLDFFASVLLINLLDFSIYYSIYWFSEKITHFVNTEVPRTGLDPIIMSPKNVKDFGLDSMQADNSNWPSRFKDLQKNISLMLAMVSPSPIYMEVELGRLSYLNQTF
ncbi:uncharacterized protein LOC130737866 [Lotus japonicus]|uniref:uncharacterized protein LOC130737866 n=1 Tax=Lotus japonicus TaxID=34305 RepID=UPI0025893007|nr:uncharacterized protein LOC130737866 [Lotus japonicus]